MSLFFFSFYLILFTRRVLFNTSIELCSSVKSFSTLLSNFCHQFFSWLFCSFLSLFSLVNSYFLFVYQKSSLQHFYVILLVRRVLFKLSFLLRVAFISFLSNCRILFVSKVFFITFILICMSVEFFLTLLSNLARLTFIYLCSSVESFFTFIYLCLSVECFCDFCSELVCQ